MAVLREAPAMEMIYLPRTSVTPYVAPQAPRRERRHSAGQGVRTDAWNKSPDSEPLSNPAGVLPSAKSPPAETPTTIDWAAEIETQAARTAVSQAPAFKDFGFPRTAQAWSAQTPEFAWDHAHSHRVETLPEGGIVINLSDQCVLVFMPFPFAFCGVGTKPANGELFKDLKDSQR